ncbi:MAG: acetate--CoA ligase family protein [Planctomycetota bacterium]|nr:acetate--CoA ligase family protein [Planctomycetota bacterium]
MAIPKKKSAKRSARKPAAARRGAAKKPRGKGRAAGASSLDALFRPRSIAVVGASRRANQIGHQIVCNLVEGGFTGPVYPVNPHAPVVHSMHCFERVSAIPGEVDLAVLVVPRERVLEAARDCGQKGVRGLVVITAGFSEVGGEGGARQAELVELCQQLGMRLIGPNCMGILNTAEAFSMNASFADTQPVRGKAAFLSQSGALGAAILADARGLGLGMSMFASVGNRADVSSADLLEYWEHDPDTDQILMYLEAFDEPERFMPIARRISRTKPILVVKSGRTASGARAAISHTGSLAGSEAAVDSLLYQCGVLRVDSMEELFSIASAVQTGKLPAGHRLAIVTNAGGPGILATDACVSAGLVLAELSKQTTRALERLLPPEASTANPVDLIASADAERFDKSLALVAADPNVDMLLAIFVAPIMIDSESVAAVFAKHAVALDKPLLTCLPGKGHGDPAIELLQRAGVPNYRFPEEAARVLTGIRKLQMLRERPAEAPPVFRVNKKKARRVIEAALEADRTTLKGSELYDLASAYGIPVVPSSIVSTREEALRAARKIGFPLVAKVEAKGLLHKSDSGGVILGIRDRGDLFDAFDKLEQRFLEESPDMQVLLQSMRSGGVETFFGAATDPAFGRMLAFGLGGIHVEILKDVVFRVHPLTPTDAEEMVHGIRSVALLDGARGKPPVDKQELQELLLRISQLLTDLPEIQELDLNPYLAGYEGQGSCILDMRVRIER